MEILKKFFRDNGMLVVLLVIMVVTIIAGIEAAQQDFFQRKAISETQKDLLETQKILREQQETIARMKQALIEEMKKHDEKGGR